MIRYLIAALVCATPVLAQQIVTSPIELIDSTPKTPGLIVNKAVTIPPVKKGTVLFACGRDGMLWRYGVGGCPPAVAPAASVAAPARIAAPIVTTAPKDFGASGQIGYGGNSNVHAIRAMDAFPLRANSSGKAIRDVIVDRARQFVTPEKAASLTINDVTIERIDAKVTKRGIYLRGDSARWTIRDFRLAYVGATDTNDYPMGIQIGGNAANTPHDILIERGDIGGFQNTLPKGYPNADGIDCERGAYNVTIRDVVLHDNTDGGLDCKATNVRLDNLTVARNGRNVRIWATAVAGLITSIDPRGAHIWASKTARLTIGRLVAVGAGPLVESEAGAEVTIAACDLSRWTGTVATKGPGKVTLGPSCTRLGETKQRP